MNQAPKNQTGLALGAWGAVQACAAGFGIALGGVIRDFVASLELRTTLGPAAGYVCVYSLEIALLSATLVAMFPLLRPGDRASMEGGRVVP